MIIRVLSFFAFVAFGVGPVLAHDPFVPREYPCENIEDGDDYAELVCTLIEEIQPISGFRRVLNYDEGECTVTYYHRSFGSRTIGQLNLNHLKRIVLWDRFHVGIYLHLVGDEEHRFNQEIRFGGLHSPMLLMNDRFFVTVLKKDRDFQVLALQRDMFHRIRDAARALYEDCSMWDLYNR